MIVFLCFLHQFIFIFFYQLWISLQKCCKNLPQNFHFHVGIKWNMKLFFFLFSILSCFLSIIMDFINYLKWTLISLKFFSKKKSINLLRNSFWEFFCKNLTGINCSVFFIFTDTSLLWFLSSSVHKWSHFITYGFLQNEWC